MAADKDLRNLIIERSRVIFGQYGLKKTTMDEIAQSVNKAKSSIYYYFKSKEEIFQAVLEREVSILLEEMDSAIAKEETSRKKLKSYILTRISCLQKLSNFYRTFQFEYIDNYGFLESIRKQYDSAEAKIMSNVLADGSKKGEFTVKSIDITAVTIIQALKGFEYTWTLEKEPKKLDQDIEVLLDLLFLGLNRR